MSDLKERYCTRKEARILIRKSNGLKAYVRGGAFLKTREENGKIFGFDSTCLVPVSKHDAYKYVDDILADAFESHGARIKITTSDNCIFIG